MSIVIEDMIGDWPYSYNQKHGWYELKKIISKKGIVLIELKKSMIVVGLQSFQYAKDQQSTISIIDLFDIRYQDVHVGDRDAIALKIKTVAEKNKMI